MLRKLVLLLLIPLSISIGQKTISLEEAISIALQRNSSLIKSKNSIEGDRAQVKSAWADLFPNLGARGSWGWTRVSDDGGTQPDFFGNLSQIPATEIDSRSYSIGAGGNVVLFDGLANIANISKSEDQLEAAEYDLENQKQNLVYQTTDYYYAVLNANEILKVRDDNVLYNQKLLETIEERNRLGSVAIADVYAQQVQLGNAQLARIRAEVDYENSVSTLLNYLALDVLESYEFTNPFDIQDAVESESILEDFDDIGVLVGEALSNRKDYMSQQLFVKSRASDLTISSGGLFPSLSANYGFSTNSVDPGELFKRRIWNVGLSLNIPIFSNLNTVTNIQLAEIQLKNAEEDLNALGRQIKIEVKQSYLNLVAAVKAWDVSVATVKSAGENRRVNNERYSLGSGTILDVLQSDKDYTEALSNRINSEFTVYKLRDLLEFYLGKLNYNKYE